MAPTKATLVLSLSRLQRYGEHVTDDYAAELAAELGIELDNPTLPALESSIRSELVALQQEPLPADEATRRLVLTDALQRIRVDAPTRHSTELVTLTRGDLKEIVQTAVAATGAVPGPEEGLRKGVQVAATQARKDFRTTRSWPLAGFGAVLAFFWSQREAFGIDTSVLTHPLIAWLPLVIIVIALEWYLVSWVSQRRDERVLRDLYRSDRHAAALRRLARRDVFDIDEFRQELRETALHGRRGEGHRIFSTVDLDAALDDASDLALERLVKLGIVEPVESWSGQEYRLAEKFSKDAQGLDSE